MNIYLVSFDLQERDTLSFNVILSKFGDVTDLHRYASFLASETSEEEIFSSLKDYLHPEDQLIITKVDPKFTGFSNDIEIVRKFMRKHRFN